MEVHRICKDYSARRRQILTMSRQRKQEYGLLETTDTDAEDIRFGVGCELLIYERGSPIQRLIKV